MRCVCKAALAAMNYLDSCQNDRGIIVVELLTQTYGRCGILVDLQSNLVDLKSKITCNLFKLHVLEGELQLYLSSHTFSTEACAFESAEHTSVSKLVKKES